jgi:hypothetical protein
MRASGICACAGQSALNSSQVGSVALCLMNETVTALVSVP